MTLNSMENTPAHDTTSSEPAQSEQCKKVSKPWISRFHKQIVRELQEGQQEMGGFRECVRAQNEAQCLCKWTGFKQM